MRGGNGAAKRRNHIEIETSSAPEEHVLVDDEHRGLSGDYGSLGLLLVLYTLQGVPMGLADSVSLLLREKHVSYKNQGERFLHWSLYRRGSNFASWLCERA